MSFLLYKKLGGDRLSTFNAIKGVTPYGDTDEILSLLLDVESDAYALKNVIKLIGTYTFSIWHKSDKKNTITFNFFGETVEVTSTTQWKKYSKTIKVSSLNTPHIYITPSLNNQTYFYEGFLSEGSLDNSWTPAPEDTTDDFTLVRAEIVQTANSIKQEVTERIGNISGSARNLIINSKTMFFNKYSLLSGGTANFTSKGVLNVNTAQDINNDGVMIFNNTHTPTLNSEGVLIF